MLVGCNKAEKGSEREASGGATNDAAFKARNEDGKQAAEAEAQALRQRAIEESRRKEEDAKRAELSHIAALRVDAERRIQENCIDPAVANQMENDIHASAMRSIEAGLRVSEQGLIESTTPMTQAEKDNLYFERSKSKQWIARLKERHQHDMARLDACAEARKELLRLSAR